MGEDKSGPGVRCNFRVNIGLLKDYETMDTAGGPSPHNYGNSSCHSRVNKGTRHGHYAKAWPLIGCIKSKRIHRLRSQAKAA